MSRRYILIGLLCCVCVGSSTWSVAQNKQDPQPKSVTEATTFSISNTGSSTMLLDASRGKTWMLRRLENGGPTWLPVPRIDSEKEAIQLWRKTANYSAEARKNERLSSVDTMLRDRGYVSIPLDRLKAGYLGVGVRIDGKKVYLMLDTGAPVTHLDLERTKHLQIKWKPWDNGRGKEKIGSSSFCEINKLEIGGVDIERLLVGQYDASDINKVLKVYLDPPIDGQLGSDILAKLNAIIDYSTLKLYLRPPDSPKQK